MTETHDLITWEEPENIGPLPNSEWVCPAPDSGYPASAVTGYQLTPDYIRNRFGGRDQHLQAYQYPEGMHHVTPVDTQTGVLLHGPGSLVGYVNPTPDEAGYWANQQPNGLLPITRGKELESVKITEGGHFLTTTMPTPGPDALFAEKSKTRVAPGSQFLTVRGKALLSCIDRGTVTAGANQDGVLVSGFVAVGQHAQEDMRKDVNGVRLDFDDNGRLDHIIVSDPDWLKKTLGFWRKIKTAHYLDSSDIVEYSEEPRVVQALAELLSVKTLEEIDLQLLAEGLYKTVGRPGFSPLHHVRPKGENA